ncbi:hypothetical protein ATANTOWER_005121, partial [Ataeniobius toweri]|nr:hypothetical protein [Ataeniobius toweri]
MNEVKKSVEAELVTTKANWRRNAGSLPLKYSSMQSADRKHLSSSAPENSSTNCETLNGYADKYTKHTHTHKHIHQHTQTQTLTDGVSGFGVRVKLTKVL